MENLNAFVFKGPLSGQGLLFFKGTKIVIKRAKLGQVGFRKITCKLKKIGG